VAGAALASGSYHQPNACRVKDQALLMRDSRLQNAALRSGIDG
jgi:hypothetical protein